jgi:hypothetical protein
LTIQYLKVYIDKTELKKTGISSGKRVHQLGEEELIKYFLWTSTAPGGFEPPTLAPKAKMLPLHHGALIHNWNP